MSQHAEYRNDGAFLAATGTRPDGSFVLRAPPRSPDDRRTFVVESREGFRTLEAAEFPSGASQNVVIHAVRALPLKIRLPEPPRESTRASLVIERTGDQGMSERWAQHTLRDPEGALGRRGVVDSVGGLVSVTMDGSELRATVLVPVGEVRVGLTLEHLRPAPGLTMNDLALSVRPGVGPLGERSLPVPHPQAGTLEVRYRPGHQEGCQLWFTLRREGGVRRALPANTYRASGMTLRMPAIAPGRYELGDAADCIETFEVPAGETRVVTVRRACAVSCTHSYCGYSEQLSPD
jgi:hypothetical protein